MYFQPYCLATPRYHMLTSDVASDVKLFQPHNMPQSCNGRVYFTNVNLSAINKSVQKQCLLTCHCELKLLVTCSLEYVF